MKKKSTIFHLKSFFLKIIFLSLKFCYDFFYLFYKFVGVPSRPLGPLIMSNISYTTVDLSWKHSEDDGGKPLSVYLIEQRAPTKSYWTKCGTAKADTASFKVTDLNQDSEYYFRITAINDEGKSQPLEGIDVIRTLKKISKYLISNYITSITFFTRTKN